MMPAARGFALLAVLLPACLPELEQVESEHVLFEHSASLQPCAGTVDYVDRMVPFLSEQLGVATPERIRYSWLTRADARRLFGPLEDETRRGVDIGYHAISFDEAVVMHEVVHAVMSRQATAPFFQEGTAFVYDALAYGATLWDRGRPDPRPLMTLKASELEYGDAGAFVYFLLARHGPEPFVEFYAGLNGPYTLARIRAAFGRAYGVELDGEVERYLSLERPCDEGYFELLAARCVAPVEPWRGDAWVFADVLACDAEGVIGGSTNGWDTDEYRVTTLEIAHTGGYRISANKAPGQRLWIMPCFGCPWQNSAFILPGEAQIKLEAGRYRVTVSGDATAGERFSVVVRALDAPVGAD